MSMRATSHRPVRYGVRAKALPWWSGTAKLLHERAATAIFRMSGGSNMLTGDLFRELRSAVPDPRKAAKAMRTLGWLLVGAGVWNGVVALTGILRRHALPLPEHFALVACVALTGTGLLMLISASGIRHSRVWGIRLGQLALIGFIADMCAFAWVFVRFVHDVFSSVAPVMAFAAIAAVLAAGQFVVPAIFGIRYLGRLAAREPGRPLGDLARMRRDTSMATVRTVEQEPRCHDQGKPSA
jgi:hypothetical protein